MEKIAIQKITKIRIASANYAFESFKALEKRFNNLGSLKTNYELELLASDVNQITFHLDGESESYLMEMIKKELNEISFRYFDNALLTFKNHYQPPSL